jgi:hypothetical protein
LTDTVTVGGSVFINIDPSSGLPIYLQIAQQIKTAVTMGRLQPKNPRPPSGNWHHFPDFPERSLKTRL